MVNNFKEIAQNNTDTLWKYLHYHYISKILPFKEKETIFLKKLHYKKMFTWIGTFIWWVIM